MLELDILSELKTISANMMPTTSADIETLNSSLNQSTSLHAELNAVTHDKSGYSSNTVKEDKSGWRLLGSKNIWKADWTDYDKRQSNRLNQQKQADKARKRKKRTSHNNIRNAQNQKNRSVPASRNNDRHRNANLLPPDRILLAEAKQRFSKPPCCSARDAMHSRRPVQYQSGETRTPAYDRNQRGIQFQRGETLNPYPADRDIVQRIRESSCNWTIGPPPRPSVKNHCASCSCQQPGF